MGEHKDLIARRYKYTPVEKDKFEILQWLRIMSYLGICWSSCQLKFSLVGLNPKGFQKSGIFDLLLELTVWETDWYFKGELLDILASMPDESTSKEWFSSLF